MPKRHHYDMSQSRTGRNVSWGDLLQHKSPNGYAETCSKISSEQIPGSMRANIDTKMVTSAMEREGFGVNPWWDICVDLDADMATSGQ